MDSYLSWPDANFEKKNETSTLSEAKSESVTTVPIDNIRQHCELNLNLNLKLKLKLLLTNRLNPR